MESEVSIDQQVETLWQIADKPSLETLAYALRHPETWPDGFVWNYSGCTTCAMGLAAELWFKGREQVSVPAYISWAAHTFAMQYEAATRIFLKTRPPRTWRHPFAQEISAVTPEHVATAIERYLEQESKQ